MKRVGCIILTILLIGIVNLNFEAKGNPNILYVGGSGEGNYTSIRDAINAANNGDIIFVFDDSSPYYENIIIDKSISLIGENRSTTIIDGNKSGDVVCILSDNVVISGFTIRNSEEVYEKAGIIIKNANGVIIENNIVTENGDQGIRIYSSDDCIIRGNIISNNVYYGIWLYSSRNDVIVNNRFYNDGLVLREGSIQYFIHEIENNTVNDKPLYYFLNEKNLSIPNDAGQVIIVNCTDVRVENLSIDGASIAVEVAYSSGVKISNNDFSNNNLNGVRLYYSDDNKIISNKLNGNGWSGLSLWFSNNNMISKNVIDGNKYDGMELLFSSNENFVISNVICNSPYGIGLRDTEGNIIKWNNIYNHSEYGLVAESSIVNARFNYWGSFFGILLGDKIAIKNSRVKIFPWLPFPNPFVK